MFICIFDIKDVYLKINSDTYQLELPNSGMISHTLSDL
jgi:hypothetical protein